MSDEQKKSVLAVLVDARNRGCTWSTIGAHFRALRLGERAGNVDALRKALLRTLNTFRKTFPKTSKHVLMSATADLRTLIEGFEE